MLAEQSRDGAGCGIGDSSPVKCPLGCLVQLQLVFLASQLT